MMGGFGMSGVRIRRTAPFACFVLFAAGTAAQHASSSAQPSVYIAISTSNPTAIGPAFAGFNVALMDAALSYTDPRLITVAQRLAPGWLRYPAGTRSEAFDWMTGQSRPEWVGRFSDAVPRDA